MVHNFPHTTLQWALPTKSITLNRVIRASGGFLHTTVSSAFPKKELNPDSPNCWVYARGTWQFCGKVAKSEKTLHCFKTLWYHFNMHCIVLHCEKTVIHLALSRTEKIQALRSFIFQLPVVYQLGMSCPKTHILWSPAWNELLFSQNDTWQKPTMWNKKSDRADSLGWKKQWLCTMNVFFWIPLMQYSN